MQNQSPIESLFSDSGPVDKQVVVDALKPFLKILREGNEVFLTEKGNNVRLDLKVLIYGLAKKLLKLENLIDAEYISAKEISENLNIKKGSVDPTFSILRKKGLILGSGTNYTIPNDRVSVIIVMLSNNAKEIINE